MFALGSFYVVDSWSDSLASSMVIALVVIVFTLLGDRVFDRMNLGPRKL